MYKNILIKWFTQTRNKLDGEDIKCYLLVPLLLFTLHIRCKHSLSSCYS